MPLTLQLLLLRSGQTEPVSLPDAPIDLTVTEIAYSLVVDEASSFVVDENGNYLAG